MLNLRFFFLGGLSLLTACSSTEHHIGEDAYAPKPVYWEVAELPAKLPEENREGLSELEAAAHVVEQGIRMAIDNAANQTETVQGQCRVRPDKGANIELPCKGVEVVLFDNQMKALQRAEVQGGGFVLPAEHEKSYWLGVDSARYHLPKGRLGPVRIGDSIRLTLEPRKHLSDEVGLMQTENPTLSTR